MEWFRTFRWRRRRTQCRGAAFLLAVYLTSLMLLVLGGTALQRTIVETRATQASRDVRQAFYSADGLMDYALAKTRRYYLDDGVCYSAIPAAGRPSRCTKDEEAHGPSFILKPTSSSILTQGKQQVLTRQLIATGVAGAPSSRRTSVVSAYVREEGPLEGAWGSRLVAVYGGGHYGNLPEIYLKGSLRSNRGVLAAVMADPKYDPLTTLSGKMLIISGAAKADNYEDLVAPDNHYVSSELLTIKNEYLFQHQLFEESEFWDPVRFKGADYPGVDYIDSQHEATVPHVDGAASIGTMQEPIDPPALLNTISPSDCNGNLALTDTFHPTSIPDGFVSPDGKVRDLSAPGDNFILLCVNAIYPQGEDAWRTTYFDNRPPELIFEKPAILYVTGSKQVTPADVDAFLDSKIRGWEFAIGAKISSALDAFGKPIPEGLRIAVTKQPTGKHSIVWMKPGKFSGSIFAPQSLIRLGERDSVDIFDANRKRTPLHLQHLVGDEIVVELAYDELTLGTQADDRKKPDTAQTTLLGGWTNHSAVNTGMSDSR